jgi:dTDP-4-amino-4,6-dideoxygalactose transaminase
LSFHATKLFHSVEGGAVVSNAAGLDERIFYARNFGHDGPERFNGVGINAKMSEFHAAMGLAVLDHLKELQSTRRAQWERYDALIGNELQRFRVPEGVTHNFSYYPVLLPSEATALQVKARLEKDGIALRRYFYPLLSDLDHICSERKLPVARGIAQRILCLPLYHELSGSDQERVAKGILEEVKALKEA